MSQPAPGSTQPGELYVDLASKEMWIGVDPSEDPNGSVIISDYIGLQLAIEQALLDANEHTDLSLSGKANTIHTHTASQITDFEDAVQAVTGGGSGAGFAAKMIMMYGGSLADIGVGSLAGWVLCDGSNQTPDLRDKFVLGAGNKAIGATNSLSSAVSSAAGSHSHTISATAITEAQMPFHAHAVSASGSGSGGTDAQGNHAHLYLRPVLGSDSDRGTGGSQWSIDNQQNGGTEAAGIHAHNVSVNVSVTGATDGRGGNQGHTHAESVAPDHTHSFTSATIREVTPYYALAFIMKL